MEDFYLTSFFGRNKIYPVLTSRGCPFSCRYYCAYPLVAGAKVRFRNIEKVIDVVGDILGDDSPVGRMQTVYLFRAMQAMLIKTV